MFLEGKGAVVTGGGRGIGAATARSLHAAGASVVVAARTAEEIEAVAAELERGFAVVCDVTDPASIAAMAEKAADAIGLVDVLVNNAGIVTSAPYQKITLEEWNRIFAVNVTGTLLVTQAFLPAMVERGEGRVVNVASIAGKVGGAYIATYAASKHAVLGLTRSLAAEVAKSGVTVNAVCPGFVDTAMTDRSIERIVEKTGGKAADVRAHFAGLSPQNRLLDPEEVAYLVTMLCGPGARGVNGQSLVVDGGSVQT